MVSTDAIYHATWFTPSTICTLMLRWFINLMTVLVLANLLPDDVEPIGFYVCSSEPFSIHRPRSKYINLQTRL
jgi:hypothetical protein